MDVGAVGVDVVVVDDVAFVAFVVCIVMIVEDVAIVAVEAFVEFVIATDAAVVVAVGVGHSEYRSMMKHSLI